MSAIPEGTTTIIHQVIIEQEAAPVIAQNEGAEPNEKHGAVVPIKAKAGNQRYACGLNNRLHAGKLYEGAMHAGTDDPQFVTCPFCKETKEHKELMEEHERHTRTDRGLYAGIYNQQRASMPGREKRAVGSAEAPHQPSTAPIGGEVLSATEKDAESAS